MTSTPLPPLPQTDKVQGTSLTCNDTVSPVSDYKEDVGRSTSRVVHHTIKYLIRVLPTLFPHSVSLDQILIQLKEVAPKWTKLAEVVGAETVNEISDFVSKKLKKFVPLPIERLLLL